MLYIAFFRVSSTKHNWNFDINVLKNFGSKYSQSLEQLALAEGVWRCSSAIGIEKSRSRFAFKSNLYPSKVYVNSTVFFLSFRNQKKRPYGQTPEPVWYIMTHTTFQLCHATLNFNRRRHRKNDFILGKDRIFPKRNQFKKSEKCTYRRKSRFT